LFFGGSNLAKVVISVVVIVSFLSAEWG